MSVINFAPISAPPFFPSKGRLPDAIDQVQANANLQIREEKEYKLRLNAQNGLNNTPPCCKSLHISLFFDGTNNNEKASSEAARPNPSNIARMYHAALDDIESGYYRYYIPGVGTAFPEIGEMDFSNAGLKYATGGEARINWALLRIVDAVRHTLINKRVKDKEVKGFVNPDAYVGNDSDAWAKKAKRQHVFSQLLAPLRARAKTHQPKILKIKLFVYGFSRGAAEARAFVNWLTDILDAALVPQYVYGPGGSIERISLPPDIPLLLGWPISVEFLGLCDTVASVGLARVAPGARGHMAWADDNLGLPNESEYPGFIRSCYHFVSVHEQRLCFPLDSVRRKEGHYPANTWEVVYPGVHSDVGGGYARGEQGKGVEDALILSQIVLHDLYAAAFAVGAPFRVRAQYLSEYLKTSGPDRVMSTQVEDEFKIDGVLSKRFNLWRTTLQADLPQTPEPGYEPVPLSYPLESVVEQQMAWMTAWRIGRFVNGSYLRQPFYQAADWNSGDAEPVKRKASENKRDEAQKKRENARKTVPETPGVPLFEPALDQQQLQQGANEFRADYQSLLPFMVGMNRDNTGGLTQTVLDAGLGKLTYIFDADDQAGEYTLMKKAGEALKRTLFKDEYGALTDDSRCAQICALYDDHIHDSRAWFMHSAMGSREIWAGYFRYRTIYSGDYCNKETSLLKMSQKSGEVLIGLHIYAAQKGTRAVVVTTQGLEKLGDSVKKGLALSEQARQLETEITAARNEKLRELGDAFIRGVVEKTKPSTSIETCLVSDASGRAVCRAPVYINMVSPVRDATQLREIYNQHVAESDQQQMDELVKSLNSQAQASQ
ncbi:putative alpha/beta hydrolase family protein DUF2235 [Enterobacter sp. BIGb0383]|uniref:T6SS phospholipase effector Tle1-like catalytic domain-containing protein n=1 Tax=unclassified Enterobacter TaxID=2608935 RepID=UPI000FB25664|nr:MULTISPECIES: DUF2235 domain-containing protein [unclassified Enterobacter]ROP61544.1 putative alpha/beta hydrolase family protein DUF2235 [Enterobacter sp. BIGb0383]ROS11705.1 putative alpha/beta hydrolase family protein DUF2235 [Enterobacter sp. BIGb0359]